MIDIVKSHQRVLKEKRLLSPAEQAHLFGFPNDPDLRESETRLINFKTAETIILDYEWIGTMPLPRSCRYMFGIYFEGVLGGALVYVEPSTRQFLVDYPRKVVQLNRGATAHWTPRNTASRMIGQSVRHLRREGVIAIIAYCTPEAGEIGEIYQACNFMYTGMTAPSTSYYLDNHWVSARTLADKIKWARTRSEAWQVKFATLPSRQLGGKFRYVLPIGTKKENAEFVAHFKYQSLPYPKRAERY